MTRAKRRPPAETGPALDLGGYPVLGAERERRLLEALADCRRLRAEGPGPAEGAELDRRVAELRAELALGNLRLVAHVAGRFRDRGIAPADLIQEGICGLLEAIDRFDPARTTRLATYATWYVRLAMQRAVAEGAYPVRLSPQHLRRLMRERAAARSHEAAGPAPAGPPGSELMGRLIAATRPPVPLDARPGDAAPLALPCPRGAGDEPESLDSEALLRQLWPALRPREQEVLALRFGLGGRPRRTLGEVSAMLAVSRERIRQIQNLALRKLRDAAKADGLSITAGLLA